MQMQFSVDGQNFDLDFSRLVLVSFLAVMSVSS